MKKALALVLALVLALSMGVSAFAAVNFVVLEEDKPEAAGLENVVVIPFEDADDTILYTTAGFDWETLNPVYGTEYYIALPTDVKYKDIEVSANGNITAELVDYDPETMKVSGVVNPTYSIYVLGEVPTEQYDFKNGAQKVTLENFFDGKETEITGVADFAGLSYKDAKTLAAAIRKDMRVGEKTVTIACDQYVNIIKITVEDNFTAHYTEGTLKIKAYDVAAKKNMVGELKVINDVTIFEYEEVNYAADNFEKGAALQLGAFGYSDYATAEDGYSANAFNGYNPFENRDAKFALVVSTTAFRAIAGQDLRVNVLTYTGTNKELKNLDINVVLKDIEAGQKGINFFAWAGVEGMEYDSDHVVDVPNSIQDVTVDFAEDVYEGIEDRYPSAIAFGFLGDQIVKGEFEITVALPIDWYELRELFGIKVEEDDIISYYLIDENGKVVGGKEIDYMTADITELVEFSITGKNQKLGEYKLVLEVPAAEEGEANPNTGAESVVGVVAALAVVSVATAAAVSLKK